MSTKREEDKMETEDRHKDPMVSAPIGTFRGSILTSFSGLPFAAYRGIPFALPPVGQLRFARPVPQPKIEGVYDATQEAPISIQPIGFDQMQRQKEDCLYLNVFTPPPGTLPETGNGQGKNRKKVLVFIHGGAYFYGCANHHVPGDLVTQGNVIVVTVTYRLSWLGFLKCQTDEVKGNMGLWDQLEALKWVNQNIKAFGGDPNDVTFSGQSMGGESVSALGVTRQAKHLFTKGILMSGSMFSCRSTVGSSDVLLDWLLEKTGLPREGKTNSELVQDLRRLPPERFVLPYQNEITNKFTTIDGELFPASFAEMKCDKEYLASVGFYDRDYLVTLTNNEGLVTSAGPSAILGDAGERISLAQRLGHSDFMHAKLYDWYCQPGHHDVAPVNDLFTDPVMMVPCFDFLEVLADGKGKGHPYFLWFDHYPTYTPDRSDAGGIVHGIDLCYLFDIHPDVIYDTHNGLKTGKDFTQEDWRLKKLYIDLIVNFMNHRKMDGALSEKLPPFESTNEYYLNLSPDPTIKQFPLQERRRLWAEQVPKWRLEESSL